MVSRWHVQTPSRTRIEFIFFRKISRLSILRFETIPTFLPTFHQFSASVLFQTSRVFCKSCTSVLQAFRECFSGFFNESTIFFRVALPSKAAEDFSTIRDKFIRGWQIFFHRSDRNRGIENGISFHPGHTQIFLQFRRFPYIFDEIREARNDKIY